MSTTLERPKRGEARLGTTRAAAVRRFVGGFFLVMGGINAGITAADPQTYESFADRSFWPFVTDTWREAVMATPLFWFLLLAASELILGLLLLRGGQAARVGWIGVLTFHVLLMPFGFWMWLWSLPMLAVLVSLARRDWPNLSGPYLSGPSPEGPRVPDSHLLHTTIVGALGDVAGRRATMLWSTTVLAVAVVVASLYGLLAESPYRSLPDSTVLAAQAQDACSIVVAALLLWIVRRPARTVATVLIRLGMLGYLLYSYLIYVTGVPMNRVFLLYVVIVTISGAGLLGGLLRMVVHPPASDAASRLRRGTGWMLLVTAVLFAGLWLSALVPFAFGGAPPHPEGVGGTPYPVFVLDLAIVLPAIAGVGVLLLRGNPAGAPLAVVALIKIVTLFTALWAGPLVALATDESVHLGPDAVPSLLLLAASSWLVVRWLRSFGDPARAGMAT